MRALLDRWRESGLLSPLLAGAIGRLVVLPFAEDVWGDAPVRLELVERWLAAPAVQWDFTHVAQFGPLPTHLAGPLALIVGTPTACRLLALVSGVAAIWLVHALARRFGGDRAAAAAAWALALSPVHVQASTTFASEAPYLAFSLGAVLRALAGDPWGLAACGFAATTTRYDTWIWLPILGAWFLLRGPAPAWKRWTGALLLAVGPGTILLANLLDSGDPLRPLAHISAEHVALAEAAQAAWGRWQWRIGMVFYWPFALLVTLTPGFGIALFFSLIRSARERTAALGPVTLGVLPPALYAFRSVVLGSFWPMTRFALGPAALASAAMPVLARRTVVACIAVALAFDGALVVLGDGEPGFGVFAAAVSPVSRLDADVRAGVAAAKEAGGDVLLDLSPNYEEILIARHAGLDRWNTTHPPEGRAPRRVITIAGAPLDAAFAKTPERAGHAYRPAGAHGRIRWWDRADP